MGILGKLFEKKECDICGGEIGLMGNRKLTDGNLCKNCAAKLSPFMTDRRQSSVEEIRQHLAYREANARMFDSIHPTSVLGGRTKVYVDEAAGKFFVSASRNWRDENPDIIDFKQVIDVRTDVTEHRTEEFHRDREGHNVPFNPRRFRFSYEFTTTIMVDSPYFNEIHFELTEQRPERQHDEAYQYYEQLADAIRAAICPAYGAQSAVNLAEALAQAAATVNMAAAAQPVDAAKILNIAKDKDTAAKAAAPQPAADQWTCACGALNSGNFCTQCGAKKPEPVKVFRCDKCGWTPEDPTNPPKFCPNCGDPFNESDRA
ncbi:MAG: DUF4428 domain-containing protein [Clostridia bacterium]|nr:DUF4428 domain-containing protein [Clostridia bacterium]